MEPTNMPSEHADRGARVPGGLRGQHHPDPQQRVPQSLWAACVGRLADVFKQLRQVDEQPNEPDQPGKPAEPIKPAQSHVCPRNPKRSCNCDSDRCADDDIGLWRQDGGVSTPTPNFLGRFRCPLDGELCSASFCKQKCEGRSVSAKADADRRDAKADKHR